MGAPGAPPGVAKPTNGVLAGAAVRLPGNPSGPLLLAEGPETGLSVWAATGYETWVALGSIGNLVQPAGRKVVVCRDDDQDGSPADRKLAATVTAWQADGVTVQVATPWATQRHDGSDFNDVLRESGVDAVRRAIENAIRSQRSDASGVTMPRPRPLSGDAAARRLRRIVSVWFDRVERFLDARDFMAAEIARTLPDLVQQSEARILARLIRTMDVRLAEALARERAESAARATARRQARKSATARFGARAASGSIPRIQIKGAAGLGKTQAIVAEYRGRPKLWTRHINVFVPSLTLAEHFRNALLQQPVAVSPDGSWPHVLVMRGRVQPGMCAEPRQPLVKSAEGIVDSIYRAFCVTSATDTASVSPCPFYGSCSQPGGYIGQFSDRAPALRIFAHAYLAIRQADDLSLPPADLVIVDESCIGALVTASEVDPARLMDLATYSAEPGQEHLIQEAIDVGRSVMAALAGTEPAVRVLRAAGMLPEHLREAAHAAGRAADAAQPSLHAGMAADEACRKLSQHRSHPGRVVAAIMAQLARDLENGREASTGVEWDHTAAATTDAGGRVRHPMIRQHGLQEAVGAPAGTPLLLLDADADLDINRRLFGQNLCDFTIPAARQAHVTQVRDAALADSTLAPDARLPNNQGKAAVLRARIAELVRRETAGGRRVLIYATLTVRRVLTDERDERLPSSVPWMGAYLSHYGRHLGVNQWSAFDTVILVGRQQLPPLAAERIARAIYADAPDVTLTLSGEYGHEPRQHDMRHGTAEPVKVQAHADPRVQAIVAISRENALGQGLDRLRLIHRAPANPARVIVVSNLPVPGLVVDRLMNLDDLLAGGTKIERALAAMPDGVLPLSAEWLHSHLGWSLKTAKRVAAEVKGHLAIRDYHCQMALYRLAGQFRPSRALVMQGVANPQAALERALGEPVAAFWFDGQPADVSEQAPDARPTPTVEKAA